MHRVFIGLAFLILGSMVSFESTARTPLPYENKFVIGYNEAWFGDHYADSWTSGFDRQYVADVLDGIAKGGGKVVRVFLIGFAGGLVLGETVPRTRGLPEGFLKNIAVTLQLARERGLRVYFTLLNSTDMWLARGPQRDYYWNLLWNKYGEADAFNARVLDPILALLNRHPDAVYAFDLMNEMEGAVISDYFPKLWVDVRKWIRTMVAYVKGRSPWLPVTSSLGWGWGALGTSVGFYSGLGLDFYDIHDYNDYGHIFDVETLCLRSALDGVPVLLGEFGQKRKVMDDVFHAELTASFLRDAKAACFLGALAWKFESPDYFTYRRADGSFRPAYSVMKSFAQ